MIRKSFSFSMLVFLKKPSLRLLGFPLPMLSGQPWKMHTAILPLSASKISKTSFAKSAKVTQCESQLEASWTALKAWKSGYKSYLNKRRILLQ
ncbi:hypothetical protein HanPSC8_Chr11g0490551 [Helianthus annuus]|nr:hypothetical protein HanPSC8_Chr11g0490551 [Helianthus annuus]